MTEVPAAAGPLINQIPLNTTTPVNDAVTGNPVVLCLSGSTNQRGSRGPKERPVTSARSKSGSLHQR